MLPRWVKRCERVCYNGITYFPLFFVYSITTWAVWVILSIGSEPTESQWTGRGTSFLGAILYGMLIWSYTAAVFTSPGTTTEQNKGYTSLPTNAPPGATSFTVKSNGELRFCKKCQARKPDRAHHCRSCNACVLKMDHHCPWLATCVGLRNYKAFMLFLVYTTLFCAVCSVASVSWLWTEIFHDSKYTESLMPVNYVMLAVISSIIGLVLAGFTGWHLLLCKRGQTTIECLEKTRYLSPLRQLTQRMQAMQPQFGFGDQSYEDLERQRERARYQEYLDEQDSEKLPNAFDLGWRRNFEHLLGPNKWLWALPISTTTGNGWSWEPSQKWLDAREAIRVERDLQRQREHAAGWGPDPNEYDDFMKNSQPPEPVVRHYLTATTSRSPPAATARRSPARGMSKADKILGRDPSLYLDEPNQESVAMQTLRRDPNYISDDDFDDFEDEFVNNPRSPPLPIGPFRNQPTRAASGFFARDAKKSDDEQRWEANDDDVD